MSAILFIIQNVDNDIIMYISLDQSLQKAPYLPRYFNLHQKNHDCEMNSLKIQYTSTCI